MWCMTPIGFFSIVDKSATGDITGVLCVRSRWRRDLTAFNTLLKTIGYAECEIVENAGTDYAFRIHVPRKAATAAMTELTHGIDYSNFKNTVKARHSSERARVYSEIWGVLARAARSTFTRSTRRY